MHDCPPAPNAAPPSPAAPSPVRGGGLVGARLLIADDCEINRMLAAACLEEAGATCAAAENGAEAVEAVGRGGVDLVLMDCQMPVMDGHEATRRIRGLGNRLPVVAVTAGTSPEELARCLEAGMDAHLAKPFDDEELLRVVARLLPAPTSAAAASRSAAVAQAADERYGDAWRQAVLDRCGGDGIFAARLLGCFLSQVAGDLARSEQAVAARDAGALAVAAHAMKGAAGHVVATPLQAAAAELERVAQAGTLAIAGPAWSRVAAEAARACRAADEARGRLVPGP